MDALVRRYGGDEFRGLFVVLLVSLSFMTSRYEEDIVDNALATIPAAQAATRGRAVNITLWIVQILLAVLFAFAGLSKLASIQPEVVGTFTKIGLGQWFRYLTGALELAGAIGLLIRRLCGLAALGPLRWSRPSWASCSA